MGLLVGGAPVGSKDYMIEKVNITVDTIFAEMKQLDDTEMKHMAPPRHVSRPSIP